ncbi:MAG: nucleotide exchange factor GrpE [Candidatus Firestonebacteria bacterium]
MHKEHKGHKEEPKKEAPAEAKPAEAVPPVSELEKYKQEAVEYKDKYLRSVAEFDNTRKRQLKEKEDFIKYASVGLLSELLPALDNFEMALKAAPEGIDANFLNGIKMIQGNLMETLGKEGLVKEKTLGVKFDPLKHEAVGMVETTDEKEEGIIKEELRTGYSFKGLTIRAAMVRIAKYKEPENPEEGSSKAENGEKPEA